MRFIGLRTAFRFLAAHPLIIGLAAPRHLSSSESGGGPPAADPGLEPFFQATTDPMIIFGPDFIVRMANAAAGRLLRVPDGQLAGRSVLESALLARVLGGASVPQRLRGGTTVVRDEVTVVDAEGQPLQCRIEALRLLDGRVLLHLQDATAALRARAALRAVEDLHRAAAEALPGVAWTMALPEERLLEVSPAVERLFGRQPAALLQHHGAWDALVHPGDRERVRAEFRAGVDRGSPFDIHFTGVHQDRRDLPHLVNHVVPVRGERAWAERAYGFIEDLSARDALQQELAETRVHLRHILDAIPTGVLVARLRRGRAEVALCNRRLAEMLRLDEPIRPGTPLSRTTPDLLRLLQGGGAGESVPRLTGEQAEEYVAELREPLRVLRVYAGPLRDAHGAVVGRILTAEDITGSWVMQRRLTQAQKMESMGRLAGGVAHDFNNLLGTILGFGSLLLEQTPEPDPRHESAAQIVGAAERASRLTLALLEFSRSARFERLPLQPEPGDRGRLPGAAQRPRSVRVPDPAAGARPAAAARRFAAPAAGARQSRPGGARPARHGRRAHARDAPGRAAAPVRGGARRGRAAPRRRPRGARGPGKPEPPAGGAGARPGRAHAHDRGGHRPGAWWLARHRRPGPTRPPSERSSRWTRPRRRRCWCLPRRPRTATRPCWSWTTSRVCGPWRAPACSSTAST